jgi:hypothetical protein
MILRRRIDAFLRASLPPPKSDDIIVAFNASARMLTRTAAFSTGD